ncbi:hypothetical protein [Deferribacter abyssi]|uniref:hypothetical protein n=1 Tax=Deferribacter abyssi TaxID=213806 RepID=UPI003C15DAA8
MKKIILLIVILFIVFQHISLARDINYSNELTTAIMTLRTNFSKENLDYLKTVFIKEKGIYDKLLAYTLLDLALKNKKNLSADVVNVIGEFYPQEKNLITKILQQKVDFFMFLEYINNFVLVTFVYYVSFFISILLVLYILIKNWPLFLHNHLENKGIYGLFNIIVFITFYLGLIVTLPSYFFQISLFFVILLISFEKPKVKIILGCFMLLLTILSLIGFESKSDQKYIYNFAAKPISINKNFSNDVEKKIFLIKSDYAEIDFNTINFDYNNKQDLVNYIILLLKSNKVEKAISLINKYNLATDPNVLYNLAVYYAKNFKFETYENILLKLQKYKWHYRIFNQYQLINQQPVYLPYFEIKDNKNDYMITFNKKLFIVTIIIFVLASILNTLLSKLHLFKCDKCGKVYCIKCDDGHMHNNICEKCRNYLSHETVADAVELMKHRSLIENNEIKTKRLQFLLSIILPGCGKLLQEKLIYSIILIIVFAINLYIITFKYELIASDTSVCYQYVFYPVYLFFITIFLLLYLINILRN